MVLLQEFREFILDGIQYVALKEEYSIHPPQSQKDGVNLDATGGAQAIRAKTTNMTQALYDIGRQDSIDFVRGLFEDDEILRSQSYHR